MGEHKLKEVVFRCIEESSDRRPSAEELTKMLQRECSKIEQKKIIANRAGGEIPTIEVSSWAMKCGKDMSLFKIC